MTTSIQQDILTLPVVQHRVPSAPWCKYHIPDSYDIRYVLSLGRDVLRTRVEKIAARKKNRREMNKNKIMWEERTHNFMLKKFFFPQSTLFHHLWASYGKITRIVKGTRTTTTLLQQRLLFINYVVFPHTTLHMLSFHIKILMFFLDTLFCASCITDASRSMRYIQKKTLFFFVGCTL